MMAKLFVSRWLDGSGMRFGVSDCRLTQEGFGDLVCVGGWTVLGFMWVDCMLPQVYVGCVCELCRE